MSSDPLKQFRDRLLGSRSQQLKLYSAIRENLHHKIWFYSQNVTQEYREVIRSQQKAFASMCSYGFEPKTIILELQHVSTKLPVFVNVDLEHAVIGLLPSYAYYEFANYPNLNEIQLFDTQVDAGELQAFCVSTGMVVLSSPQASPFGVNKRRSRAKKVASPVNQTKSHNAVFPPPGMFDAVTINGSTDDYYPLTLTLDSTGTVVSYPCTEWHLPRTRVVYGEGDNDSLKESRREYLDALQIANMQWYTCVDAISRLQNVPDLQRVNDPDHFLERVIGEVVEALNYFVERVVGDSRIEIKKQVVSILKTYILAPTYFQDKYLNFALTGGAGTGKTTVAKALGLLLGSLGILVRSKMTTHSRSTLVASYVGQTAEKTRGQLVDNLEAVMFVDEAYSIAQSAGGGGGGGEAEGGEGGGGGGGGGDKYDMYGVESINEFINFMDKTKGRICIITAGYEVEMKKYWFGPNEGMARRMPFVWKLSNYTASDLFTISTVFYRQELERTPLLFPHSRQMGGSGVVTMTLFDIVENPGKLSELIVRSCDKVALISNSTVEASRLRNQAGDVENVVRALTTLFIESLEEVTPGGDLFGHLISDDILTTCFSEYFVVPLTNQPGHTYRFVDEYDARGTTFNTSILPKTLKKIEDAIQKALALGSAQLVRVVSTSGASSIDFESLVATVTASTGSAGAGGAGGAGAGGAVGNHRPTPRVQQQQPAPSTPSSNKPSKPASALTSSPAPSAAAAQTSSPSDAVRAYLTFHKDKITKSIPRARSIPSDITNENVSFHIDPAYNFFEKHDGSGGDYLNVFFGTATYGGVWMLKELITTDAAIEPDLSHRPVLSFQEFVHLFSPSFATHVRLRETCLRSFAQFMYVFYYNWGKVTTTDQQIRDGLQSLYRYMDAILRTERSGWQDITQKLVARAQPSSIVQKNMSAICFILKSIVEHGTECATILELEGNYDLFKDACRPDYVHLGTFDINQFALFCARFLRCGARDATMFGRARRDMMKSNIRQEIHRLKQNPTPQQRLKVIQMIHHQSHFDKHGLTIAM